MNCHEPTRVAPFLRLFGQRIELIVYDFDGIMTNNRVLLDQCGNEAVFVNRADGLAVSELRKTGVDQIIISTEENPVVARRAEKLQIRCLQGVSDKRSILSGYLNDRGINWANVLYVGNDLNDLDVMRCVGLSVAPADACAEIRGIAKVVVKAKGGDGVARELLDIVLDSRKSAGEYSI